MITFAFWKCVLATVWRIDGWSSEWEPGNPGGDLSPALVRGPQPNISKVLPSTSGRRGQGNGEKWVG